MTFAVYMFPSSDNYAYVFVCPETGLAACVDPVEPSKILSAVRKEGATLALVRHIISAQQWGARSSRSVH
jgi:glyoxylase-like metal-dependent hydrolase (beta-lactamase superfamily II)